MRQSEAAQDPPDGGAMNLYAVGLAQLDHQLVERDLPLAATRASIQPVTPASLP